ncbi:murein hydrolase activator EnvC family protein [Mangrovibacterium diazotrophicum]|uniref:Septal ring factor EnvC (AmiA/AmiB activator) n=1 Tax=Mangrovibacterium diazotrophicum TaxID=1261403 RepID=A0A419WA00_9BACT|nr:peptidoglycan DD-metalloendopeptidase family protein [Mangrovibacterium diazotrophicum]RKD92287.1 septal ring factor EnvC (AmiA/AmiB activator) [Mangrovibacterium diazotrophicum]
MKRLLFIFSFLLAISSLQAQSIAELRAKKSDAEKQIRLTNSLLEEAQKNEKASLSKLQLLKSQIAYRSEIIESINSEIEVVDWSIANNNEIIGMLQSDLDRLKKEYASMIRFAQKNKNSYDLLIFLFSADNVNQAYKRWLYLRQYAKYRRSQADIIRTVSESLDENLVKLNEKKELKTELLQVKITEFETLEKERGQQNSTVATLQKKQRELRIEIKEQQKIQDELDRQIQKILEEEAKKSGYALTPEQKLIASDFEKNKGRIPWPVARGIITEHFGVHSHPVLKQIQVRSNGIDISTAAGSKARAVFEGEVSRVFAISGGNMAVIIRHGSFLSVYSNLREVTVKPGQKVALKQEIGTIFTDPADGNTTVMKFQIWKESQKLDPEEWISN